MFKRNDHTKNQLKELELQIKELQEKVEILAQATALIIEKIDPEFQIND